MAPKVRSPRHEPSDRVYASTDQTPLLLRTGVQYRRHRMEAADMITIDEAAEMAGTTRMTINAWIKSGRCIGVSNLRRGYISTLKVWIAGAKRGVTAAIQRKLKRRNAVEPMIGHLKSDGRLARNFLKGIEGDAMNALLCGAGHNMRKILKKLRLLCAQLGITLQQLLYNAISWGGRRILQAI